uniref:Uncharacterized protein n=1 Tax=Eutreptiella gymnastica TaxID=73025 RepID=A0A7S4G3G0_9EUGL
MQTVAAFAKRKLKHMQLQKTTTPPTGYAPPHGSMPQCADSGQSTKVCGNKKHTIVSTMKPAMHLGLTETTPTVVWPCHPPASHWDNLHYIAAPHKQCMNMELEATLCDSPQGAALVGRHVDHRIQHAMCMKTAVLGDHNVGRETGLCNAQGICTM